MDVAVGKATSRDAGAVKEIKKKISEHKPILRERFKVKSIGIFGSYLRGETK